MGMSRKQQRELRQSNQIARKGGKQPDTKGSDSPSVESLSERVITAIDMLDDNDPKHWTRAGHPSMKAIEELVGDSRVSRDMVESLSSRKRKPKSER